jgi:hypothetical protein
MRNDEMIYREVNANNNNNFVMLYQMMNEYNSLNNEQKKKYMNLLTGWLMKEKDILNLNINKQ